MRYDDLDDVRSKILNVILLAVSAAAVGVIITACVRISERKDVDDEMQCRRVIAGVAYASTYRCESPEALCFVRGDSGIWCFKKEAL